MFLGLVGSAWLLIFLLRCPLIFPRAIFKSYKNKQNMISKTLQQDFVLLFQIGVFTCCHLHSLDYRVFWGMSSYFFAFHHYHPRCQSLLKTVESPLTTVAFLLSHESWYFDSQSKDKLINHHNSIWNLLFIICKFGRAEYMS